MSWALGETQRDQGIDVKQIFRGNSAKISRTCLLLKRGAPTPALRTGRPVIGSTRRATFEKRVFRGVNANAPGLHFRIEQIAGLQT